jgi:hypothetical protein
VSGSSTAHVGDLIAGGGQEVHVLRQRPAQGAGHGRGAAIVDQVPPDLRLDHLAELGQLSLVALELQPPCQRVGGGSWGLVPRLGQPRQQPVRVDGPQRAEHVVGAGHRAARLDPGVPVHEHAREGAHHDLVALAQGGQQQLSQGRVIQGAEASPGTVAVLAQPTWPPWPSWPGSAAPGCPARRGLRGLRGEVQVETAPKASSWSRVFTVTRAARLTVARSPTGRPQAVHRVDPLGERDRDRSPQLGDHASMAAWPGLSGVRPEAAPPRPRAPPPSSPANP